MHNHSVILSIVIPVLNAGHLLLETLRSVACQEELSWSSLEVIVIDGGSKDDSVEVARSFNFVARVISEPDSGIYDAMNKGATVAHGYWLQFMNAGDVYSGRGVLAAVVSCLQSTTSQTWAIAGAQNLCSRKRDPLPIKNIPHRWHRHALGLQSHCHQACLFRRDAFFILGAHSSAFGTAGDFDIILRFGLANSPAIIPIMAINYLGGGVSEMSARRTAWLLHEVRVARMELGYISAQFDALLAELLAVLNWCRRTSGLGRRRWISALGQRGN